MKAPVRSADILIPKTSFEYWSVVACDQFTSDLEYWKEVERTVNGHPSAYKIMLPEIYLEGNDVEKRIDSINSTMNEYLSGGVFAEYKNAMIYVERTQPDGKIRQGIVAAVDLEEYDYSKNSKSLIRATEGTVLERIPPRVRIRKDAPLEMPHVMLLIDDKALSVIEKTGENKQDFRKLYDFDLMSGGGHIKGYLIPDEVCENVITALENLSDKTGNGLLFAVGDGNHSLATAKECYERLKTRIGKEAAANHPSRYALAEIVNIHSPALEFEPIYRVLFNCDPRKVVDELKETFDKGNTVIKCFYDGKSEEIGVKIPDGMITVGALQSFIDALIKKDASIKVDYIHGEDEVERLSSEQGRLGFVFEGIGKDTLFASVSKTGALPRKTFSMGTAYDKRYYLECRKIK